MKNKAIVLGGTADKAFAISVFLLSFLDMNSGINPDAIIFHDGFSEKEKKVMDRIYPCRFINYQSPFSKKILDGIGGVDRFTPMVFTKYECLSLLKEYETVVWFDYDMIAAGRLDELFEPVKGGTRLMLTQTLGDCVKGDIQGSDLEEYECSVGVHSSVMAFYNTLANPTGLYRWCLEMTEKYAEHLKLPEQVIFSLMIHKFHIPVYPLPFQLYSPHPVYHRGTLWDDYVKIWHTYGEIKFWNGIKDECWNKYYKEYKSIYAEIG